MKKFVKLAMINAVLPLILIGGCATGHINPADRDTTGAFDGVWIGEVSAPRARSVTMPGHWIMNCNSKPFEITLVVFDGMVSPGYFKPQTPVSSDGKFRIDVYNGTAVAKTGIMPGNSKFLNILRGNFSEGKARGTLVRQLASVGGTGCSSTVRFRRE